MSAAAPATYLFVPGHRPELIAKARRSAADAVVIDLEDAVAPEQRPAARAAAAAALAEHAAAPPASGQQLWVRLNAAGSAAAEADLAALGELLTHARVPKVTDPAQLDWFAARAPRLVATLPAVECAAGLLAAPAVAAHPLVVRLGLGGVDLVGDLGCADTPRGPGRVHRQQRRRDPHRVGRLRRPPGRRTRPPHPHHHPLTR